MLEFTKRFRSNAAHDTAARQAVEMGVFSPLKFCAGCSLPMSRLHVGPEGSEGFFNPPSWRCDTCDLTIQEFE